MLGITVYVLGALMMAQSRLAAENEDLYRLLTQERNYECYDILVNAEGQIPDYFDGGKKDSALIIMDYVDKACQMNAFGPLRVLMAVESGDFSSAWSDSGLSPTVLQYYPASPYQRRTSSDEFPNESRQKYDSFLSDLAHKLAAQTVANHISRSSNTVASFLIRFY